MLTPEDAFQLIVEQAHARAPVEVRLGEALGMRLARDVTSDIDSPPHDKAMVDGYAVRYDDLNAGQAELEVIEEITAGEVPHRAVLPGGATRIMTGAPVPENADAVVMVERTELSDARVRIDEPRAKQGMNIMRRGESLRCGEMVMSAGQLIRPLEVGLLSEVGCTRPLVTPGPQAAILATGNELTQPQATPGPGQIRNSNGPMLAAAVTAVGGVAVGLGIARDDPGELQAKISEGLEADVLLLCGGVSAGKLDLAPAALEAMGVRKIFHKVSLKPGKPLWFGVRDDPRGPRLVFGLPGNPVSAYVCFQLFVRPALARLAGSPQTRLVYSAASLAADHHQRGDRTTFYPAHFDGAQATPVAWQGSADLRGFARANALLRFPPGTRAYPAGATVEVLVL